MNYEGHGFTVRVEPLDADEGFRVRMCSKMSNATSSFSTAWEAAACFAEWVKRIEVPS